MRSLLQTLLRAVAALSLGAAGPPASSETEQEAIRLLVRGDDMGFSHASNLAHIRCYREGVMRTVEVLVAGPWFPEAARMLRENPGLDVGLHLTLTSEWDNLKWRPLTQAPSLADAGGWFHPMIRPRPGYGADRALGEQPWKLAEIERELRAQIQLAKRELPQLSHLSAHMGFTRLGDEVAALVKRLGHEYGVAIDPQDHDVGRLRWEQPRSTPAEKIATFERMLEALGPGTWLFVDHPALDTPETRAIHHVGYEDVAIDRQGVTDAWTSRRARAVVERRGIQLISYKDLAGDPVP